MTCILEEGRWGWREEERRADLTHTRTRNVRHLFVATHGHMIHRRLRAWLVARGFEIDFDFKGAWTALGKWSVGKAYDLAVARFVKMVDL